MTTPAPCIIRHAAPQDFVAILECLHEAFEPFRRAYTPEAFADTVPSLETLQHRSANMTILVAVNSAGGLIGTIAAGMTSSTEGHLRGMAVCSDCQGHGVAGQLLASAEALLQSRGCRRVTLDTTEPLARAISFYRKNGYSPTGRTQDFYGMPLFEFAKDLMQPILAG